MLYNIVKRVMDVILSIVLIILFSPIMALTALIIWLTSPGPILVEKNNLHMQRIGKDGRIFRLFKFRSMFVHADTSLKNDPHFKKLYKEYKESSFKLHKDPRVTPFGKFIRKYSIDEMPQLFNVLGGDMSLVGPRPYHADEIEEQQRRYPGTEKFVKETQTVKPGITGYWQVSGRSKINFDKRIEMDALYARRKSIAMDLMIILKTPFVMITGAGAV